MWWLWWLRTITHAQKMFPSTLTSRQPGLERILRSSQHHMATPALLGGSDKERQQNVQLSWVALRPPHQLVSLVNDEHRILQPFRQLARSTRLLPQDQQLHVRFDDDGGRA